jgi:hypothetical protein
MRRNYVVYAPLLLILLVAVQGTWARSPDPSAGKSPGDSSSVADGATAANRLVQLALESEIEGDLAGREIYLREALELDPQNTQAHWQLGEIYLGDRWMPVEEACRAANASRKRAEYRQRRGLVGNLPENEFDLALWCKQIGLIDEGRAHLFNAWDRRPALMESSERLGLVLHNGVWMTPEQFKKEQELAKRDRLALSQWKPRLSKLRRELNNFDTPSLARAAGELTGIDDPSAVPAIEAIFSAEDARQAMVAVRILENIRGQRAATSLVRHAILSNWAEVRQAAAKALQGRSLYSYAPLLLAALESPIDAKVDDISQDGTPAFRISLTREGPMGDFEMTRFLRARPVGGSNIPLPGELERARETARQEVVAAAVEIGSENERIRELNERVGDALTCATSVTRSQRPRDYWEWWYDYNDIYYPEERPIQRVAYETAIPYQTQTLIPRAAECFAAGTPVWTVMGVRPIEQLVVGDCVLAQDVETGQLAFKPVLSTSIRPPSLLLNIRIDGETLTVTRGHPLWVVGKGWRMAKEVALGDRVRTANGAAEIESIEPGPKAEAYNLVVAEFNTYFAGQLKLLVHDNTLRRHTDAVLPGLELIQP